jgi:oligopeptide/dipeptide ABC transporter ATP-binding protein
VSTTAEPPLVELIDVEKRYGASVALRGVSLELRRGRTVGLVGESGSGKSTVARLVLRLERPTGGELRYRGASYPRSSGALRPLRRAVGIVFQDPYDSLDSRFKVGDLIAEPLKAHGLWREGGPARVDELLRAVGLGGLPQDSYPGELSGGQRQRLGIARALALDPELVVLDEPTSALDVSIQAQILNLLLELQAERGLGYLFISHDLEIVRRMSDEIVVIYGGAVMEQGPGEEVSHRPRHPYTVALLAAIPGDSPDARRLADREPAPEGIATAAAEGCPYSTRCPRADARCRAERPPLAGDGHLVACHYPVGGTTSRPSASEPIPKVDTRSTDIPDGRRSPPG